MNVRGVDFSGAAEPGMSIWLTEGSWDTETKTLTVEQCQSATRRFGETAREPVLAALRTWLQTGSVTGVDVSFGLPQPLLPAVPDWSAACRWVAAEFDGVDALAMQSTLKARARENDADGVELKRRTDVVTGANSPYSFITRYQTLHAIRDVLDPLVADGRVSVEPMAPRDAEATLLEVYPAATLRELGLPGRKYKNDPKYPNAPARRETILDGLCAWGVELDDGLRPVVLDDSGGDALDSVVAAVATARAVERAFEPIGEYDPLEGYIYT